MHIIPVIDLLDGHVVHAKHGQRHNYRPISSKLSKTSKPVDIVKAFLDIYPFQTLYIADLNGILCNPNSSWQTIETISTHFPNLTIWLDAGIPKPEDLSHYQHLNITPILGSESMSNLDEYQSLQTQLENFVFSIDINQDGYIGPKSLLDPKYWPSDLIVMTLAKVGSQSGVDMHTLMHYQQLAPHKNIYAAGGVRNLLDLKQIASANINGALIASALHDKKISADEITSLMT